MKLREMLQQILLQQQEMKDDLRYHIKRTDLLEAKVERDLPPVKRHVDLVNGMAKVFSALVALSVGVIAIVKFFQGM